MSQQLGTCSISGVFTIRLSLAPPDLPDVVARQEPDVDVTEVPGGLVIDSLPHSPCNQRTLVSDTGHVMFLEGTSASRTDCGDIELLGPLVLANLAQGVPTIEWPQDSAGRMDLCAAVTEAGIGGRAALSADEGCRLWVDLGENAVLAELVEGGRDVLKVHSRSAGLDCSALPAALDSLVSSLAH